MEKQYICYQKDGKSAFREATPEELANMQIHEPVVWHKAEPFRVLVSNGTWKDWLAKKRDHAD